MLAINERKNIDMFFSRLTRLLYSLGPPNPLFAATAASAATAAAATTTEAATATIAEAAATATVAADAAASL